MFMFMSMNIRRHSILYLSVYILSAVCFCHGKPGATVFVCIVSNMFGQGEWVWESNSGKLEGMCEWLDVCVVCVCLRVKQYPEALQ